MGKIKIATSSCLLGNPVRYDGQHKRHKLIVTMLDEYFECVDVCPEMLAGLGTPRPPVQLVQVGESIRALGVDDRELDVTGLLEKVAADFIEQYRDLGGMILQSRSPSCGLGSTSLFNNKNELSGQAIELTDGIFASRLTNAFPGLPMKQDTWFVNKKAVVNFVGQVKYYADSKLRGL